MHLFLFQLEIGLGVFPASVVAEKDSRIDFCFNPCFVGNRSGSVYCDILLFVRSWFQSLFCWKSVWEWEDGIYRMCSAGGFNPCFVGNRSGSSPLMQVLNILFYVSILVLLEIGLGARFNF